MGWRIGFYFLKAYDLVLRSTQDIVSHPYFTRTSFFVLKWPKHWPNILRETNAEKTHGDFSPVSDISSCFGT
jgi:hypothetical protein